MPSDFPAAFAALRTILKKHSDNMVIKSDTPNDFAVLTPAYGPNKKPIWFGAVLLKKSAVTYHLFPLYFNPTLQAKIDPSLLPRKQGKTCFNFLRPDDALFTKLDELTAEARQTWQKLGYLSAGPISNQQWEESLRRAGVDTDALDKERKKKGKQAAEKTRRDHQATLARRVDEEIVPITNGAIRMKSTPSNKPKKTKPPAKKSAAPVVKRHPIIKSAAHLRRAAKVLAVQDPKLAPCFDKPIKFKLAPNQSPYATLFQAIVHQQLSPKAASTILGRVKALFPGSTIPKPPDLLATPDPALRAAGLSRNKITALKDLAAKTLDGTVPTSDKMLALTDDEIVLRLTSIYGIGQWTVEMLLIFHLGRRDVFPVGDYALRRSIAQVYGYKEVPTAKQIHHLGESWRPHRTAASLYLWNFIDPANSDSMKPEPAGE